MTKLLSDDELKHAIAEVMGWNQSKEDGGYYEPGGDNDYSCNREMSELLDLINTQKRLHAESERLKAKEELLQGWLSWIKSGGGRIIASQIEESLKEVRAEQIARIK